MSGVTSVLSQLTEFIGFLYLTCLTSKSNSKVFRLPLELTRIVISSHNFTSCVHSTAVNELLPETFSDLAITFVPFSTSNVYELLDVGDKTVTEGLTILLSYEAINKVDQKTLFQKSHQKTLY